MQREFNKLEKDKQRKFLIKNIIKDDFFGIYCKEFSSLFIKYIYPKNKCIELNKEREQFLNNSVIILRNYKDNIIDFSINPTTELYNCILDIKKTISELIKENKLDYRDENNYSFRDLIIDAYYDTINLIYDYKLSLIDELLCYSHEMVTNLHPTKL
jgi:hypothetical protein